MSIRSWLNREPEWTPSLKNRFQQEFLTLSQQQQKQEQQRK